jgi:hypothetical protein
MFGNGELEVADESAGLRLRFERCALVVLATTAECDDAPAVPEELSEPVRDPRALLDRASIIHTWIQQH